MSYVSRERLGLTPVRELRWTSFSPIERDLDKLTNSGIFKVHAEWEKRDDD